MRWLIGLLVLLLSLPSLAQFRCQGKIIGQGMTQGRVQQLCGKPTSTYHWVAVEKVFQSTYPVPLHHGYSKQLNPQLGYQYQRPVYVSVNYSRWMYSGLDARILDE